MTRQSHDGSSPRGPRPRGTVRAALVEAGVQLARSGGPDAVVLREVTRMVGVVPNAAYRHFPDRDALLAAVRDAAIRQLAQRMAQGVRRVRARRGTPIGAQRRLGAVGRAYLELSSLPAASRACWSTRHNVLPTTSQVHSTSSKLRSTSSSKQGSWSPPAARPSSIQYGRRSTASRFCSADRCATCETATKVVSNPRRWPSSRPHWCAPLERSQPAPVASRRMGVVCAGHRGPKSHPRDVRGQPQALGWERC
jgi:Bacterial regulatory proteins, tetR family